MGSDWKKFRARVPAWRERYLSRKNPEVVAILTDPAKTPTEQFWEAKAKIEDEATVLRDCFDGHSRSRLQLSLMLMHRHGVIGDADLEEFSDELRRQILESFRGNFE